MKFLQERLTPWESKIFHVSEKKDGLSFGQTVFFLFAYFRELENLQIRSPSETALCRRAPRNVVATFWYGVMVWNTMTPFLRFLVYILVNHQKGDDKRWHEELQIIADESIEMGECSARGMLTETITPQTTRILTRACLAKIHIG